MMLTSEEDLFEAECPNCGHPLRVHARELGCTTGWERTARKQGCLCPLSLAEQFGPPSEHDLP